MHVIVHISKFATAEEMIEAKLLRTISAFDERHDARSSSDTVVATCQCRREQHFHRSIEDLGGTIESKTGGVKCVASHSDESFMLKLVVYQTLQLDDVVALMEVDFVFVDGDEVEKFSYNRLPLAVVIDVEWLSCRRGALRNRETLQFVAGGFLDGFE